MSFLSKIFSAKNKVPEPKANFTIGALYPTTYFNGEKTPYEMGNPHHYFIDYYAMRLRAWEAYIKTDFVQNAIRKYILWVLGPGLKTQSEPIESVLRAKGINQDLRRFSEDVEAQFRLFANTRESTYNQNEVLHELAERAMMNSILAGDCLIVARYNGNSVNAQVIDGGLISTPIGSRYMSWAEKRGNQIIDGVEINKKGKHIAYYIKQPGVDMKWQRIKARQSDGTLQAWLMIGQKGKQNDVRGMSLLAAVLETSEKMGRYKDASLSHAEQSSKFVASIQHDINSDGTNPLMDNIAQAFGKEKGTMPDSITDGEIRAPKIAEQVQGTVVNLGVGQKLVKHTPEVDVNFENFWNINIEVVYATLGIPPEVAKDLFGGSYSSSRAALKSWEYKIATDRTKKLHREFYGPIFDYWLNIAVLKGDIQAEGYLDALVNKDFMVLAAYRNKRFIGTSVPHIDPVKEVTAERMKLGENMKDYPLTTVEQSMENLNTGDVNQMIKKRIYEQEIVKELSPDIGNGSSTVE